MNICSEPAVRVERVRTRDRRGLPGADASRVLPRLPHQDQEHWTDICPGKGLFTLRGPESTSAYHIR